MVYAVLAAVAGLALGFFVGLRERSVRHRAWEAHWDERIRAVERGRERHRAAAEESRERVSRMSREHGTATRKVKRLERELRKLRKAHAGCDAQARELEQRIQRLDAAFSGSDRGHPVELTTVPAAARLDDLQRRLRDRSRSLEKLRAELAAAGDAHAGCDERIQALEARIEELEERRDRSTASAKRLRFRRHDVQAQH